MQSTNLQSIPVQSMDSQSMTQSQGAVPVATSALLQVEHDTRYAYRWPVELAHHVAFLRPLEDERQQVEAFEMSVEPEPSRHASGPDVFGNQRVFFSANASHQSLRVLAKSKVRIRSPLAFDPALTPPWEQVRDRLRFRAGAPFEPASEFCAPSPYVPRLPALKEMAETAFPKGRPVAEGAIALMHTIFCDFSYQTASTTIDTPLKDVLLHRRGVCQDFAHLMIGTMRWLGLSARYVSGYLLTTPPPGAAPLTGSDASHAWVSVFCPGVQGSWFELDPTNDLLPSTQHVRLAMGRDYSDVTPLRGVIRGGGRHSLDVRVKTTRLA